MTCIIESNEGKASSTTILNLSDVVHITKKEADDIVTKFSQDGWLVEVICLSYMKMFILTFFFHLKQEMNNFTNSILSDIALFELFKLSKKKKLFKVYYILFVSFFVFTKENNSVLKHLFASTYPTLS